MNQIIKGKVIKGKGLGHKVGMPTANIELKDENVKLGVYASITSFDNERYMSVTNVGPRPSIDNSTVNKVETYILDFSKDIYGQEIEVELVKHLRDIQKFNNIEEVHEQVEKDIKSTIELLKDKI